MRCQKAESRKQKAGNRKNSQGKGEPSGIDGFARLKCFQNDFGRLL
jgi:hypothetical protein